MRHANIVRETKETQIQLELRLDGKGVFCGKTGIGFMDHMLTLLARHGDFDIKLRAEGDLEVDNHHLVEDLGIVFGQAFRQALGNKGGIRRYGSATKPMDEALITVALDFSGRFYFVPKFELRSERVGDFETQCLKEFLYAFAMNNKMNLHVICHYGDNDHHIIEGIFKTLASALKEGIEIIDDERRILSTKGVL